MKKILLGVAILLLITSVGCCQDQPLQFTIKSDKEVYETNDEVLIECVFRNISEGDILFNSYFFELDYIIKDSQGRTISRKEGYYMRNILSISKQDFIILKPGESYKRTEGIATTEESIYYYKLKPDIYSIQAAYINFNTGETFGLNAWTGTLISCAITIEVVENYK